MPKLATGRNKLDPVVPPGSTQGFSLIELLVVIVIAGVLTTLAVLRFGGNSVQEQAERSLNQLDASLQLLCDQALLTAQVRGLRVAEEGFDFWTMIDGQWRPIPPDQPPLARRWPDLLTPDIQVNQRPLNLGLANAPQIWCSALEPLTPFELTLNSGQDQWRQSWPVLE